MKLLLNPKQWGSRWNSTLHLIFSLRLFQGAFCFLLLTHCGSTNIFEPFSKKDSDKALLVEAKKNINLGDYASALTNLGQVSEGFKAAAETKTEYYETHAAASAGQCGLVFTEFTSAFSGSSNFITKARDAFLNKTVSGDACETAQADMEALGTKAERTANQNFFLAILGLAKMGVFLRTTSDADNDGLADAAWTGCAIDPAPETPYMTEAQVKSSFTGFGLLIDNLSAIGATVSGLDSAAITALSSSCDTLMGTSCTVTSAASVTAPMVSAFRKLLDDPTNGIGSCAHAQAGVCCSTDP